LFSLTILSALLALNQHRLYLEQSSHVADSDAIARTKLGLRSTVRVAVQTAEIGSKQILKAVEAFPFWTIQFLYNAAIIIIDLDLSYGSEIEQAHGLKVLGECLKGIGKRWRIAGTSFDSSLCLR
jgi:hypothetical protein